MFKFLDGIFNNDNKYHYDAVNKKLREVETMFDELINIYDKGADKNMCLLKLDMIKIEVSTLRKRIYSKRKVLDKRGTKKWYAIKNAV